MSEEPPKETAFAVAKLRFADGLERKAAELELLVAELESKLDSERLRDDFRRRLHGLYASTQVFRMDVLGESLKVGLAKLDEAKEKMRPLDRHEHASLRELVSSLRAVAQQELAKERRISRPPLNMGGLDSAPANDASALQLSPAPPPAVPVNEVPAHDVAANEVPAPVRAELATESTSEKLSLDDLDKFVFVSVAPPASTPAAAVAPPAPQPMRSMPPPLSSSRPAPALQSKPPIPNPPAPKVTVPPPAPVATTVSPASPAVAHFTSMPPAPLSRPSAPASTPASVPAQRISAPPPVWLGGRVVLVVDDDPSLQSYYASVLLSHGASVLEVGSSEEALSVLRSRAVDAVLCDVWMPDVDGFAFAHALRHDPILESMPLVLLSWKDDMLERVQALDVRASRTLRKEASGDEIVACFADVLAPQLKLSDALRDRTDVSGALGAITPIALIRSLSKERDRVRLVLRSAWNLYEVFFAQHRIVDVTRTAVDGSFVRGVPALAAFLGAHAGRFEVTEDDQPVRTTFTEDTDVLLARASEHLGSLVDAVSGTLLSRVEKLSFDNDLVDALVKASPPSLRRLVDRLRTAENLRALVAEGDVSHALLEVALVDLARSLAILEVRDARGNDLIEVARKLRRGDTRRSSQRAPAIEVASVSSRPARDSNVPVVVAAVEEAPKRPSLSPAEEASIDELLSSVPPPPEPEPEIARAAERALEPAVETATAPAAERTLEPAVEPSTAPEAEDALASSAEVAIAPEAADAPALKHEPSVIVAADAVSPENKTSAAPRRPIVTPAFAVLLVAIFVGGYFGMRFLSASRNAATSRIASTTHRSTQPSKHASAPVVTSPPVVTAPPVAVAPPVVPDVVAPVPPPPEPLGAPRMQIAATYPTAIRDVVVDGRSVGVLSAPFDLSPGRHVVEIKHADGVGYSLHAIDAQPGQTAIIAQ